MLPPVETAACVSPAATTPPVQTPAGPAPAVPVILTRRADFVAASRARRQSRPGLMLQARRRDPDETTDPVRIGFTCSKKVGNAVARNRAKRRLRAAARDVLAGLAQPGWDYVLIGRPAITAERPFSALCDDLASALAAIHETRR